MSKVRRSVIGAGVVFVMLHGAASAQDASISSLLTDLESASAERRQAATKELLQQQRAAIPSIELLIPQASAEASARCIYVLGELYLSADSTTVDAAEKALERISQSPNRSAAVRANTVLRNNYLVRQRRAVLEINKLGGVIELSRMPGQEQMVQSVRINKDWKGDDSSLRHIERLSSLQVLYLIKGHPFSDDGLKRLQETMPGLSINRRGSAYLGISGGSSSDGEGCQVFSVAKDAAAANAGLEPGDIITSFGGKPVKTFDELIKTLANFQAGDKVTVVIERAGGSITKEIQLGDWR